MPKRRSLVGTAREAIGAPPERPPEPPTPPAKPAPARAKSPRAAARKPAPPARPQIDPTPEPRSDVAPSPATAYEAMMGFASATFRQNLETGAKLARCKSPMEALAAQTAHAAALTQTFIAVSLRLMQLSFSTASWASIRRFDRRAEPQ